MAISLKHAFVSAIPDDGDTSRVRPSDWNNNHVLTQSTGFMLGRLTAGIGATEEISASALLAWSGAVAKTGDEMSGVLTVNANATALPTPPTGTRIHIGGADATPVRLSLDAFGSSPLMAYRSAVGTNAAKTALTNGWNMGSAQFFGYGATGYSATPRAVFAAIATENWTDTAQGARFVINTTPNGSTTIATRFIVDNDGSITPGVDNTQALGTASLRWNSLNVGTGASQFGGKVGIGQAAAAAQLGITVAAAGTAIQATDNTYGTFAVRFNASTGIEFGSTGGSPMNFMESGTNRMRIAVGGAVSILGSLVVGQTLSSTPGAKVDGGTAGTSQTAAVFSARGVPNAFEWGHSNAAGYANTFGYQSSSGAPYIVFNGEAGSSVINTIRTRGVVARGIIGNNAGNMSWFTVANANLDNQALIYDMTLSAAGNLTVGAAAGTGKFNVRGGRSLFEANSEIYATSLSYGAGLGVVYQGATNSATPDYVLSNNAGTSLLWFTYSGSFGLNTSIPNFSTSNRAITINGTAVGDTAAYEITTGGAARAIFQSSNGFAAIGTTTTIPILVWYNYAEHSRFSSAGLGINTAGEPNARLDVNGSVAFRGGTVAVANGLNSNIATPAFVGIRLTGPTGAFSVGGLTGGVDGRIVKLYNTVSQTMTIVNEDASSTAGNRITTLTGANIVLRATNKSHVTLRYDATDTRWIVESIN